jgi:putative membrane protein
MRAARKAIISMAATATDTPNGTAAETHGRTLMKRSVVSGGLLASSALIWSFVISAAPAVAQPSPPYYGPHMWSGGWWMLFGPVTMILFIGAIVALMMVLVRRRAPRNGGSDRQPAKTPIDILRERFARGEIDKEEFEERRRVLNT